MPTTCGFRSSTLVLVAHAHGQSVGLATRFITSTFHGRSRACSTAVDRVFSGVSLLAVNFYRHEDHPAFDDNDIDSMRHAAPLILACVERHLSIGTGAPSAKLDLLTARERDVCERMLKGWTHEGIAADLGVSPATVKTYRDCARGGKFLMIHGQADQIIPTKSSEDLYNRLVASMGAASVASFLKFYEPPGYGHGAGAFNVFWDSLTALENWVEHGTAPIRRDPMARHAVDDVDSRRISYIAQCFSALGFDLLEARSRAFLLYAYEVAESLLFNQGTMSQKAERSTLAERLLLTKLEPST